MHSDLKALKISQLNFLVMKQGIHPATNKKVTATCSCGASFVFDSTAKEIKTEICSACHPFYTGKQKLVDTAGKVDKFRARMEAAKGKVASKKKGKISENVKAAAAAASASRNSAVDSAKVIQKVTTAAQKREIAKAKLEEDLKTKKDEEVKAEAEAKPEAEAPADKAEAPVEEKADPSTGSKSPSAEADSEKKK